MLQKLKELKEKNVNDSNSYQPFFYRLSNKKDREKLRELLEKRPDILVYDEIYGQISELIKSRNPQKVLKGAELEKATDNFFKGKNTDDYGVWVYYPWSGKLVHLLDEEEFIEVRTNRNHYKITPEEKEILSKKKIGIIGLSVGHAVAKTLAMERTFGELRLGDFDELELSNLNRIKTGVHNLGINKTISIAREIAEIDPFLNIKCFNEGITEENIDNFIFDGGKLNILVDECDGLHVKILSRQKAKKYGIPMVMELNDRGTVDVERFDLEPDRPLLHGFINHLDLEKVKEAKTNEEKVPYLLPMVGENTISNRLKASFLEVEQSITTWPQLASQVTMGGGIVADVCRRIALDQYHESGRYFIDLEELIGDKNREIKKDIDEPLEVEASLSKEKMIRYIKEAGIEKDASQITPEEGHLKEIVYAATLAPSGANAQPWKFLFHDQTLYLFADDMYKAELLDCKKTTTFISLGAAAENLVLKAHELNYEVKTEVFSLNGNSKLVSLFRFYKNNNVKGIEPHVCDHLVNTIPDRCSNRKMVSRQEIDEQYFYKLKKIAQTIEGGDLKIVTDKSKIEELAEITGAMDRIRMTSKTGHKDFRGEARWTIEEARKTRNGISFQEVMDLTPSEYAGFKMSREWDVARKIRDWGGGMAFEKIQKKWLNGASALGLITMPRFGCNEFFNGGRVLERVWLEANKQGIETHPPSLAILIFNTLEFGDRKALPEFMREEAQNLLYRFNKLFEIDPSVGKVLLLRFFKGDRLPARSLRYSIDDIFYLYDK